AVVFLHRPELAWDAGKITESLDGRGRTVATVDALIEELCRQAKPGDQVIFMSNGGFENAPRRFVESLRDRG
ncbi:MAG: UDP-N-acetylmuramate:L-alanyl-gamma-D-glutamyl-meso-diaminopimelate ligase, partial [Rhodanobacter sp.]